MQQEQKDRIRQSILATRDRRSTLECKVYPLKITFNKLSKQKKEILYRLFLEAKWMKNHIIASGDIFGASSSMMEATVKLPGNRMDTRKLNHLSSHMKQSLVSSLKGDIKSLSVSKKNGQKVGKLQFSTEVTSIDLKQYGNTYKIDREKSKARVQSLGWVKVSGMNNIPETVEFANAKLIHKPDGFYLHVVTYAPEKEREYVSGSVIGLDFGLSTSIATSKGDKLNLYAEETDRLKRLQKKLSRQTKGSHNYKKTCHDIAREYQKMENKKNDLAHKIVSDLSHYEHVFFQDEMISSWKRKKGYVKGGKKIQKGILGRVKALLRDKEWVTMLDRSLPTTQLCVCGAKNKHQLDERIYFCSQCGHTQDRDIHAAQNMVRIGLSDNRYHTPQGLGEAPVEENTSALHFNFLKGGVSDAPVKQETNPSLVGW